MKHWFRIVFTSFSRWLKRMSTFCTFSFLALLGFLVCEVPVHVLYPFVYCRAFSVKGQIIKNFLTYRLYGLSGYCSALLL